MIASERCLRAAAQGLVLPVALAGAGAGARADDAPETLDLEADFELVFNEPFDIVDVTPYRETPSRWIAHTPWFGDFGDARFVDPDTRPGFPFRAIDGVLRIEASKNDDGGWESGLLSASDPGGGGFRTPLGYFEARMRLPPGAGVWPAFWLVSDEDERGRKGEIDVIEFYGHDPASYQAVWHVWGGPEKLAEAKAIEVEPGSLNDRFRDYGVEITEDRLVYYLDRRVVWDVEKPEPFDGLGFYPLVNLALGSGWPIDEVPDPSHLWVDHIRIWRRR